MYTEITNKIQKLTTDSPDTNIFERLDYTYFYNFCTYWTFTAVSGGHGA